MGRVERDQLLTKDQPPQLPPQDNPYTPAGAGGSVQPSPAILADPNVATRMQAVRDVARSAAGRMPAPLVVDEPGRPGGGGGEALPTRPWNPPPGQPAQPALTIPSIQDFARKNFPNIAGSRYITAAEMKLVQDAYKMELGRLQAVGSLAKQQGGGAPAAPKEPSNLPGMVGHAALHPELYTPEAIQRLTEAAELIYGKDGKKGRKGTGMSAKGKAEVQARFNEAMDKKVGSGNPDPTQAFPGLKGNQMGPGYQSDVIQSTMMDNEDLGTQGLISLFKEKPVEAWIKARALQRAVLPEVNPKLSAVLKNFLDKFRPDPKQVLDAMDAGTIDREQANGLLEYLMTDEEQAAMGVGNDRPAPAAPPAKPPPLQRPGFGGP